MRLYETFHDLKETGFEVGRRRPRIDGVQNVTGARKFVDDIYLPNMLVCKGVYSRFPHARIKVNTGKAKRLPGVRAIITGRDFPHNRYQEDIPDHPCLAEGKVRYKGEWIAVIAAESQDIAEEAAELIDVQYEELPAVFDARDAMKPGAPVIHEEFPDNIVPFSKDLNRCQIRNGDMERGFNQADHIFEHTFATPVQEHAYLEPHSALADIDGAGKLTVCPSPKCPSSMRGTWLGP